MIQEQDRSGWFGASDVGVIMGNWTTPTFRKWWMTKLGFGDRGFVSREMNAGTYYEHAILDFLNIPRRDHQILLPDILLRVNLDGDGAGLVCEVKTHKAEKAYKPTSAHRRQVCVQMYAKLVEEKIMPTAVIASYGLLEEDYSNFFNDIAPDRLFLHRIEYDSTFMGVFLKRVSYLAECLRKGVFPDADAG